MIFATLIVTADTEEDFARVKLAASKELAFCGSTPAYRLTLDEQGWGAWRREVSRMAEQGNEVQFHKGCGVIRNMKTGAETRSYTKGGVYVLALWVRVDQHKGDEEHSFHRQGA